MTTGVLHGHRLTASRVGKQRARGMPEPPTTFLLLGWDTQLAGSGLTAGPLPGPKWKSEPMSHTITEHNQSSRQAVHVHNDTQSPGATGAGADERAQLKHVTPGSEHRARGCKQGSSLAQVTPELPG